MIDIHSHILPGVDDGAKTTEVALDMLRMAIDSGVTTQVLTPHIHPGTFDNNRAELEARFRVFRDKVEAANLPITVLLGAELRIGIDIMQLAASDAIPSLGLFQGKRTFLLEFPPDVIPHGSAHLVQWLLKRNVLPIVVHPERNRTFAAHEDKLKTLIDLGCPIQITAGSLRGKFGKDAQRMAEALLQADTVAVIASDSHNTSSRAPDLHQGYQAAINLVGHAAASRMVKDHPQALTQANPTLNP